VDRGDRPLHSLAIRLASLDTRASRGGKAECGSALCGGAVGVIEERWTSALRVRRELTDDPSLTMRSLRSSRWIIVASPAVAARLGPEIADLASAPTLDTRHESGDRAWRLERFDGATHVHRKGARMTCTDFSVLCDATADELGVTFRPDHVCAKHIASGGWFVSTPTGTAARASCIWSSRPAVFSRPSVRTLFDELASRFPKAELQ
jgi:DNA-binding transcriptional LysR family regulator